MKITALMERPSHTIEVTHNELAILRAAVGRTTGAEIESKPGVTDARAIVGIYSALKEALRCE